MCVQCAAGAMTAVAGASGMRLYLEARVPWMAGPRIRKVAGRGIVVAGVLAAGVLGPSAHGPASSPAGPSTAAAGVAVTAPAR
jgi:hypothetical protein